MMMLPLPLTIRKRLPVDSSRLRLVNMQIDLGGEDVFEFPVSTQLDDSLTPRYGRFPSPEVK